jgi:hypothetical protein
MSHQIDKNKWNDRQFKTLMVGDPTSEKAIYNVLDVCVRRPKYPTLCNNHSFEVMHNWRRILVTKSINKAVDCYNEL